MTTDAAAQENRSQRERILFVAVLIVFAILQLARVSSNLELGNGTYYLRDAITFAQGNVARSRYSPGLPILLVPVVWATGGDPGAATLVTEILMVGVSLVALILTYRVIRRCASVWMALGVMTAFTLGQSGLGFLRGINAEPIVLALVAAVLLLGPSGRSGWAAAALSGAAVFVRVAVAPFFGILWLVRLRRHPVVASSALLLVVAAGVAHFATGPVADPSYVEIAESIYDGELAGQAGMLGAIVPQIAQGLVTFGRYGVPRLVWPFRVLATPIGGVVAASTLVVMVWGLSRRPRFRPEVLAGAAVYLALLLLWPIRVAESVRLVVPVAPILLAGLAVAADRLGRTDGPSVGRRAVYGVVGGMAILSLLAGFSGFLQNRTLSRAESDFLAAHREAAGRVLEGPVISRKPAVTELMLGVPAIGYPPGDPTQGELERYARGWSACVFVVDGLGGGDESLFSWVRGRGGRVLAEVGETRIVGIQATWCP